MKSRGICSRPARSSTEYSCATSAASPWSSTVVRRSTSVLILPSLIAIVLRTCSDTSGSCVTTRIVTPSSVLAVRIAREHLVGAVAVQLAGGLVGQQHRRLVGQRDADRDPLLLAAGHLGGHPVGAVCDADQVQQLHRPGAPLAPGAARPAASAGRRSRPLSGARTGFWRSAATGSRRPNAGTPSRSFEPIVSRSWPATRAWPAVGVSRPARMFSSVDLPLPDAPTSAVSSPGSTTRSRPCSAWTSIPAVE